MTEEKKPEHCAKCGERELRHECLIMYGKWGQNGKGYRFNVFICQRCGFSEMYFLDTTIWV